MFSSSRALIAVLCIGLAMIGLTCAHSIGSKPGMPDVFKQAKMLAMKATPDQAGTRQLTTIETTEQGIDICHFVAYSEKHRVVAVGVSIGFALVAVEYWEKENKLTMIRIKGDNSERVDVKSEGYERVIQAVRTILQKITG